MQVAAAPISRRRAASVAFLALAIAAVSFCVALALDVGYVCALTTEAQDTADSTALAGALMLQQGKADQFLRRAQEWMGDDRRQGNAFSSKDQIIEIGTWDSRYRKFQVLPPQKWNRGAFAIRVSAAQKKPRLAILAKFRGVGNSLSREAVAVGSRPCHGIWGLEGITVEGELKTDSYVSEEGPYDAETASPHGDLCSGRGMTIDGFVTIRGDAMAGYGYPVTGRASPTLTGITTNNSESVPKVTLDDEQLADQDDNDRLPLTGRNGNPIRTGNHLVIGPSDDVTIPAGRYSLASFTAHETSTVRFTGPTVLLISGNMDTAGARLLSDTKDPRDLTIVCTGSSVKVGGDAELHAEIVAPKAEVRLRGPADVYGQLLGRTVRVAGNLRFHVDESLPNRVEPPPPFAAQ